MNYRSRIPTCARLKHPPLRTNPQMQRKAKGAGHLGRGCCAVHSALFLFVLAFTSRVSVSEANCSFSLSDEAHMAVAFEAGSGIVLLNNDTSIVTQSLDKWSVASWSTSPVLQQTDIDDFSDERDRTVMAANPHTPLPYIYVFNHHSKSAGCEIWYKQLDESQSYPLRHSSWSDFDYSPSSDEQDSIANAVVSSDGISLAVMGDSGGVRRVEVNEIPLLGVNDYYYPQVYPSFNVAGKYSATALVFSPDASTLYLVTSDLKLVATDSLAANGTVWIKDLAGGNDLCHAAVSPDGISIYVVSRGTDELAHLHLSSAETSPSSTDLWWHPTVEAPFTVGATDEVVVVGAEESDELSVFQRDTTTGILSSMTSVSVSTYAGSVEGTVGGFVLSSLTNQLFLSMRNDQYNGGVVILQVNCTSSSTQVLTPAPTPAPSVASAPTLSPTPLPMSPPVRPPTPSPTRAPTPSPTRTPTPPPTPGPTVFSSRPELEQARLAAAVDGLDIVFELGRASSRLWCHGKPCYEGVCSLDLLFDNATVTAAGEDASCTWNSGTTARVVFGTGYTLGENSTVKLNPTAEYLAGCATCEEYATGSTVVRGRAAPPELASAGFSKSGAQIMVEFIGSASSRTVEGIFGPVRCEDVFSNVTSATLGAGCKGEFTSSSTFAVTLGSAFTILSSIGTNCSDGDGTSLWLLDGVVRTEAGAFLSTPAGCVAVTGSNLGPISVQISAPVAVGSCSDLTLEGIATYPPTGFRVNWTMTVKEGGQLSDLSNATNILEQANLGGDMIVNIPSAALVQGTAYSARLGVSSALGVSADAVITIFKSSDPLPNVKILGPASLEHARGQALTLRSATDASPCALASSATYSWSLEGLNTSRVEQSSLELPKGRDPRVLRLPPNSLGYAGSVYAFRLDVAVGNLINSAVVTVEVVPGIIVAAVHGGTKRTIGTSQALTLNASQSVDQDDAYFTPFLFAWSCTYGGLDTCSFSSGEVVGVNNFASGAVLTIPAGSLPIGVDYVFSVNASKISTELSDSGSFRSASADCIISTVYESVPHVVITPKVNRRKYSPTSKLVLNGCAAPSMEDICSARSSSKFDLQWNQVIGNLHVEDGWMHAFTTAASSRNLVARAGVLGPGQLYTFSLSATDSLGSVGYAEFTLETNAPPLGGYITSDRTSAVAGEDEVVIQSLGWTDDFDDLPITYSFGYVHGYEKVLSIDSASTRSINQLSTSWSSSTTLSTVLPPGTASTDFNLTFVVTASDNLGSAAITSLGQKGLPTVVASTLPDEGLILSLVTNMTKELSAGNTSLTSPEAAVRRARSAASLLLHAPRVSSNDSRALAALQDTIIEAIVQSYLTLDATPLSAASGAQVLAEVLTSDIGATDEIWSRATLAAHDMVGTATADLESPKDAFVVPFLRIFSWMLTSAPASSSPLQVAPLSVPSTSVDTVLAKSEDQLALLSTLCHAIAAGSEAQEELDTIGGAGLAIQLAKVYEEDLATTTVSAGANGTQISFPEWETGSFADDGLSASRTFSVAAFTGNEAGLKGVTVVDAWGATGNREELLPHPIEIWLSHQEADDNDQLGCTYWSEEDMGWETDGLVMGGLTSKPDATGIVMQCTVFHLSAFTSRESPSTTSWNTVDLLDGFGLIAEYGAESWPAVFFVAMLFALFVLPSLLFWWKDAQREKLEESLEVLRRMYLAQGRARRALNPVKKRVKQRRYDAVREFSDGHQSCWYDDQDAVFHRSEQRSFKLTLKSTERAISELVADSVLFNHPWRSVKASAAAHFKRTLLTRSQHLLVLLADWMSAIAVQAVFYGKDQFGIRQKAEMTAVTAVIMLPAAFTFPALLRLSNTPPESMTRAIRRRGVNVRVHHDSLPPDIQERQDASPQRVQTRKLPQPDGAENSGMLSVDRVLTTETSVYKDVMRLQKGLLAVNVFLPVAFMEYISEVLNVSEETTKASGDNEQAFLHNITISLSIVCAVLSALSACAIISHSTRLMIQSTVFQAVVAPGLALCGVLLFGSSVILGTGAVLGGFTTLASSYFAGVQRQLEQVLEGAFEAEIVSQWSKPTTSMHNAAEAIQCCFRKHYASVRLTRAREFETWVKLCRSRRRMMHMLVGGTLLLTLLCLTYTNMVFAAKFDRSTCIDWLTTCMIALLVEGLLQQPVVLLATGVLGDFVEDGATFLLDLMS